MLPRARTGAKTRAAHAARATSPIPIVAMAEPRTTHARAPRASRRATHHTSHISPPTHASHAARAKQTHRPPANCCAFKPLRAQKNLLPPPCSPSPPPCSARFARSANCHNPLYSSTAITTRVGSRQLPTSPARQRPAGHRQSHDKQVAPLIATDAFKSHSLFAMTSSAPHTTFTQRISPPSVIPRPQPRPKAKKRRIRENSATHASLLPAVRPQCLSNFATAWPDRLAIGTRREIPN